MVQKPYHHGNLRNALIETGINLINEEGLKHFSLRRIAAECGVSHAAPYSYFASAEELLQAMEAHITEQFVQVMEGALQSDMEEPNILLKLGRAYVRFFIKNPHYFDFLFSRPDIPVNLSLQDRGIRDYRPFEIFKITALDVLGRAGVPEHKLKDQIIALWAMVQGIAFIATMENVYYDEKWEDKIEDLLTAFDK